MEPDLSDADLRGWNLRIGYFSGTNLSGANLSEADLCDAELGWVGVDLDYQHAAANLSFVQLEKANCRNARLSLVHPISFHAKGALFTEADFTWADLSQAEGNILQTCLNPLGLRVQLARANEMIVGVDLSSGHWRLWNWAPIQETTWRVVLSLDPLVTRAHVVTAGEQEQDGLQGTFWLIEELGQMIRVSKRDVFTLQEVDSSALLTHVHLVEPQLGAGPLDWPTEVDACVYQGKLLISGVDENQHLFLYQVG